MSYVISLAVDGECKKEPDPETGKLTLPVLKLFKLVYPPIAEPP